MNIMSELFFTITLTLKVGGAWIVLLQMRRRATRTDNAELVNRDGMRTPSCDHLSAEGCLKLTFVWFHVRVSNGMQATVATNPTVDKARLPLLTRS